MSCIVCHLKYEQSCVPATYTVNGQSVCIAHVSMVAFGLFNTKREARARRRRFLTGER